MYFYLATLGYWYFNNENLDLSESEKKGLQNYNLCLDKYKESDIELYECINEKKLLEYAKFCFYRMKDKDKAKKILEENNLGEKCKLYRYSPVLSDIIKFKEVISDEVAIE